MNRIIISLGVAAAGIGALVGAAFAFDAARDGGEPPPASILAPDVAADATPSGSAMHDPHAHDHVADAPPPASARADVPAGQASAPSPEPIDGSGVHMHDEPLPAAPSDAMRERRSHHARISATPEEIACGNDLVRRTQEATARFADFDVALAEGYRPNRGDPSATHYPNPAYTRDGVTMDLARPESLIYRTDPATGEKVLLGALFKMPRGQSGPQPCGAITSWHTHANCVDPARESIPVEHGAACPEGMRYAESVEMMHVWFIPGRANGVAPRPVEEG